MPQCLTLSRLELLLIVFLLFFLLQNWCLLSAETNILLLALISLMSSRSLIWKSLRTFLNSRFLINNNKSFSGCAISSTAGGHFKDSRLYVSFLLLLLSSLPRNSKTFHRILFITSSVFDVNISLYCAIDAVGIFFFE